MEIFVLGLLRILIRLKILYRGIMITLMNCTNQLSKTVLSFMQLKERQISIVRWKYVRRLMYRLSL